MVRVGKMAQWLKALAAKSGDLNFFLKFDLVEKKESTDLHTDMLRVKAEMS